jgi:hypothetical protein
LRAWRNRSSLMLIGKERVGHGPPDIAQRLVHFAASGPPGPVMAILRCVDCHQQGRTTTFAIPTVTQYWEERRTFSNRTRFVSSVTGWSRRPTTNSEQLLVKPESEARISTPHSCRTTRSGSILALPCPSPTAKYSNSAGIGCAISTRHTCRTAGRPDCRSKRRQRRSSVTIPHPTRPGPRRSVLSQISTRTRSL